MNWKMVFTTVAASVAAGLILDKIRSRNNGGE